MDPVFSLIASAKNSELYKRFCDSAIARIPFEIIFVGPNLPTEIMPNNFRYIQTNVKPVQCLEVAARNATGEYLMMVGDDFQFSIGLLDRLYNYTLRLDMGRTLISFRYFINGRALDGQYTFMIGNIEASFIGIGPLFKRNIWNSLGGLDKRFVGTLSDLDMQMRFYEYGMQPFLASDCIMNEIITEKDFKTGTLYLKCGVSDTETLNSLWTAPPWLLKKRATQVQSFDNDGITVSSQGSLTAFGTRGQSKWN